MTTVSVVIICYNQERYIREAIESVLNQSAKAAIREIVVVDDGSRDKSAQIISEMASHNTKIRLVQQANSGGCAAPRNAGIPFCTGDYIGLLDGDDLWTPDKVEVMLEAVVRAPNAGLLFSDYVDFDDETGAESIVRVNHYEDDDPKSFRRFFVLGGPVPPSCALVKREAFDVCGVFDPAIRFNEDSEMWLRIAAKFPIHHIKKILVKKRAWFGSLGSMKYGAENLEFQHEITRRVLRANPELASAARERTSRVSMKTAYFLIKTGKADQARKYIREAVTANPSNWRAWAYLFALGLPINPDRVLDRARGVFTRLRSLSRDRAS